MRSKITSVLIGAVLGLGFLAFVAAITGCGRVKPVSKPKPIYHYHFHDCHPYTVNGSQNCDCPDARFEQTQTASGEVDVIAYCSPLPKKDSPMPTQLKDSLLNDLHEGMFVGVELTAPISFAKGKIEKIVPGHISTLHAPGKQPTGKPTLITVMCPITIQVHPDTQLVDNVSALVTPDKEKTAAEVEAAKADVENS